MTHLNTCRNEKGQTYSNKGFSSPPLVNDRANLQRIPSRENNQILYDNRSPFEIFSLVPHEPSKHPRNSTSVHKLHLSAFLVQYIENVITKSMTQLGIRQTGSLHSAAPWSQKILSHRFLGNPGGVSEPLLCFGPEKTTTGTGSLPWITSVCIFMAAPISPTVLSTNEGVSLCYSQQFFFFLKYPFSKNAFQYVPGTIRTVLWE